MCSRREGWGTGAPAPGRGLHAGTAAAGYLVPPHRVGSGEGSRAILMMLGELTPAKRQVWQDQRGKASH